MSKVIPEGYTPFLESSGYIALNGPYYEKKMADGTYRYGFASDERHSNPNNVIHGAALVGFADTILGHNIVKVTGRYCATITLTTEFITGTSVGNWIEAAVRIKKTTRNMAFANADVYFEEKLLLSATSIFKLFE